MEDFTVYEILVKDLRDSIVELLITGLGLKSPETPNKAANLIEGRTIITEKNPKWHSSKAQIHVLFIMNR